MSQQLEKIIAEQLQSGKTPSEVHQFLMVNDYLYTDKKSEYFVAAQYLYKAGLFKELLNNINLRLNTDQVIAWDLFYLVLKKVNGSVSEAEVQAIIRGATEQDELKRLARLPDHSDLPIELKALKKSHLHQVEEKALSKKEDLFNKLFFLKHEGLLEEEAKVVRQLEKLYPDSPKLREHLESFNQRWATHLLSHRHKDRTNEIFEREVTATEAEQQWLNLLYTHCQQYLESQPSNRYNLSIMFFSFGAYEQALSLLHANPQSVHGNSLEENWLILELFLKTRRFLQAIEWSEFLEQLFFDDPESTFAITYHQAMAYWGLHQGAKALELMQGILSIRPQYRSAQTLYNKWSGGM